MKTLIGSMIVAAAGSAIFSYAGVLTANSIVPFACIAVALILMLLHLISVSDRRY